MGLYTPVEWVRELVLTALAEQVVMGSVRREVKELLKL